MKHAKKSSKAKKQPGYLGAFSIVELIIVIIIIAILATLATLGYGAWRDMAAETEVKNDLNGVVAAMEDARNFGDGYPVFTPGAAFDGSSDAGGIFSAGENVSVVYVRGDASGYCVEATSEVRPGIAYFLDTATDAKDPQEGACGGGSGGDGDGDGGGDTVIVHGVPMQTITSANCPTERTRAVDARDNRTYWVQEMADGKCWMLTNLAYAGGGVNTYGDTKSVTNGGSSASTWTTPHFYIPTGANLTTEPTDPSTSTTGTGQYGYLYNWCAAMGSQIGTAACSGSSGTIPSPNTNISICPAGWRLPTGRSASTVGGAGEGEFGALINAVNGGSNTTDEGLRNTWLAQRSGIWRNGYSNQSINGYYWSSSPGATNMSASRLYLYNPPFTLLTPTGTKTSGQSVRCLAV